MALAFWSGFVVVLGEELTGGSASGSNGRGGDAGGGARKTRMTMRTILKPRKPPRLYQSRNSSPISAIFDFVGYAARSLTDTT